MRMKYRAYPNSDSIKNTTNSILPLPARTNPIKKIILITSITQPSKITTHVGVENVIPFIVKFSTKGIFLIALIQQSVQSEPFLIHG